MPNRIFSDRAWVSDKVASLPEEYRAEYAWIYSVALADGTFECDAKKIWASCYVNVRQITGRGAWTVAKVGDMLDHLTRSGLLLTKTDSQGKLWGMWYGCETFLPDRTHRARMKCGKAFLFLTPDTGLPMSGQDPDNDLTSGGTGLGLGLGIGIEGVKRGLPSVGDVLEEAIAEGSTAVPGTTAADLRFTYRRGLYPGTDPKKIFAHIARAWTRVRGEAAVCRYPSKFPENWERMCDSHSGDIMVPAFELWASKHGYNTDMPIVEFLKVAGEFMQQILPLKDIKPKTTVEDVKVAAANSLALRNELFSDEKIETTEPGPEAF